MQPPKKAEAENVKAVPTSIPYTPQSLRSDIRTAELAIAAINPQSSADQVLDLFILLDRIVVAHEALSQSGADLRPETTRIETIHSILNGKARNIDRVLHSHGELDTLRTKHDPPPTHWWWYLDRHVDGQKTSRKKRLARNLGIVVLVLATATAIYMAFLRPDATTRSRVSLIFAAEADLQSGDYASALANYQKAQVLAPDDAETNLMIGVMYQALDRLDDAERQYAKTVKLYETRATFVSAKSQKYSMLGWYDKALVDALEATELDQQFAPGHCALATAYEGQDQYTNAIAALQVCSDLAFEQGQNELYVIAKTRLGNLLQMPH